MHQENSPGEHEVSHLEPRVAALEVSLTAVAGDVSETNKAVQRLTDVVDRSFAQQSRRMDQLQQSVSATRETKWPVVFGGLAIVISLVGMGGAVVVLQTDKSVEPLSARVSAAESQLLQHEERFTRNEEMIMEHRTLTIRSDERWNLWLSGHLARKPVE